MLAVSFFGSVGGFLNDSCYDLICVENAKPVTRVAQKMLTETMIIKMCYSVLSLFHEVRCLRAIDLFLH